MFKSCFNSPPDRGRRASAVLPRNVSTVNPGAVVRRKSKVIPLQATHPQQPRSKPISRPHIRPRKYNSATAVGGLRHPSKTSRRIKSCQGSNRQSSLPVQQYKLPQRSFQHQAPAQFKHGKSIPKPSRLISDLKETKPVITTLHMPIVVHSSWTRPTTSPSSVAVATRHQLPNDRAVGPRRSSTNSVNSRSSNPQRRAVSRQTSRERPSISATNANRGGDTICTSLYSKIDRDASAKRENDVSGNSNELRRKTSHEYLPYNPSFGLSATEHKDIQSVIKRSQQRREKRQTTPRKAHKNASCQQFRRPSAVSVEARKLAPPSAPANLEGSRPSATGRPLSREASSPSLLGLSSKRFARLERAVQNKLIERLSQKNMGSRRQQSTGSIDRTTTGTSAASPTSGLLGGGGANTQQGGDYLDSVLKCVAEKQYAPGSSMLADGAGTASKGKTKTKWLSRSKTTGKLSKTTSLSNTYLPHANSPYRTTKNTMHFVNDIYQEAQASTALSSSNQYDKARSPSDQLKKVNPHYSAYTQKLMQLTPRDSSEHSTPRAKPQNYRTHRGAYEDDLDFALDPGGGAQVSANHDTTRKNQCIGEADFLDHDGGSSDDNKRSYAKNSTKLAGVASTTKSTQNLTRDSGAGSGSPNMSSGKRNNMLEEDKHCSIEREKSRQFSKYVKQLKRKLSNAAMKGSVMALSKNATESELKDDRSLAAQLTFDASTMRTQPVPDINPAAILHRSSTIVRPPSGRPKINRAHSTANHQHRQTNRTSASKSSAVHLQHQNAIIRRHQLNLHASQHAIDLDKIAPKPPSENPSYASKSDGGSQASSENADDDNAKRNRRHSSSESEGGGEQGVENIDDDVSSASEDEGVIVTKGSGRGRGGPGGRDLKSKENGSSSRLKRAKQHYSSNAAVYQDGSLRPKSSFKSTITSKLAGKAGDLYKSQTFITDGVKYRARYASTNNCHEGTGFLNDMRQSNTKTSHKSSITRQASFAGYRHKSNAGEATGNSKVLHNKFSASNNELASPNNARRTGPFGHKVGGSNSALARRFQKNSPKPTLTAAQISEKIKKEIDVNSKTTAQLNLLMNKTMKWVMTQEFEKYRDSDDGSMH